MRVQNSQSSHTTMLFYKLELQAQKEERQKREGKGSKVA